MTNEQIIFNQSVELMKQGILKGTGKMITVKYQNEAGEEVTEQTEEPEIIHTFAIWKQLGYQVKKGQKAKAAINIWKCTIKNETIQGKNEKGEPVEINQDCKNMFKKTAFFFTFDQVEKIAK